MYRAKTVEALLRHHEREKQQLLAIVREQNDRIMVLAGKPWTEPPADTARELRRIDADQPDRWALVADPEQLPDYDLT